MPTQMIVRSEEKILVEALGSRKQIGREIFFEKRPGYEYPVAEMDRTVAKPLLHGASAAVSLPSAQATVPEIYHGHNINFREAVPIKKTGKKEAKGDPVEDVGTSELPVLSDMTWGELRKHTVSNGVEIQGKKRPEIEAELLELNLGV